jgi:threonyl-tRNA synthetase
MLIVGEKDEAENTVSVRSRANGDEGATDAASFIARVREEIDKKISK